ncbi:pyrokinin-1 receptor-like [Anoplophora glabripennis]|uniref:pyrokinin-1 receptor-like n=1 Tax=Anoplophora glabripennis TaxID=217634 RepID=UPI000873E75D|nr:pyrokinin-1 receptor-like [Anoplophora glabripennis]
MSVKDNLSNISDLVLVSNTSSQEVNLYPFSLVVPFTIVYVIIFFTGVIGNVSTCVVIAKNKSMHTATNYYLFSLAVSDMVLLISGLPPEMYRIWSPDTYVFGEAFCVLQGFAAETSANASILIITAFTVERYLAICHPFLSHTMSKLSRAVRYIIAIWIVALALAIPQAIQFGIEVEVKDGVQMSHCTVVKTFFEHAFEISTFVFFVGPMTLISILYVLIWIRLKKSKKITAHRVSTCTTSSSTTEPGRKRMVRNACAQNRVVKMLIAVVAAFFICWAPFHAQRLLAVYLAGASMEAQQAFFNFYLYLMHTSGVLYFVSTTINPLLYHIMSRKFRKAFKDTFSDFCGCDTEIKIRHYTAIRKLPPSMRNMQRSVSDGVTQVNRDFLGLRRGRPVLASKNPSSSKGSQHTRISFFSNEARCSSMYERNKSYATQSKASPGEHGKYLSFLPVGFRDAFKTNEVIRTNLETENCDSANTISNSSLKDTDMTEFNYSDLVNDMIEINKNIS